jgi:hypothetical protein
VRAALALVILLASSVARADDAGDAGGDDAALDEGVQPTTTAENLGCAMGHGPVTAWPLAIIALLFRRRRRVVAAAAIALTPAAAHAQTEIDDVREPEPVTRRFAIYVNPMSLIVNRYGGSLELLLASHHALEAGAYYVYSAVSDGASRNVFEGVGGELGYRLYLGQNGFRGFYVGPSFLIAALDAVPQSGATVSYLQLGGALDLGWEALVADRVLVGIGAGAEYTANTKSFPAQQIPASVYANDGIRPRVSVAIGVAF